MRTNYNRTRALTSYDYSGICYTVCTGRANYTAGNELMSLMETAETVETNRCHSGFTYTGSRLILSTSYPFYIGVNPDGIVECSCCGKGVLEV